MEGVPSAAMPIVTIVMAALPLASSADLVMVSTMEGAPNAATPTAILAIATLASARFVS